MKRIYFKQGQSFLDYLMSTGLIVILLLFFIIAFQVRNKKGVFNKSSRTAGESLKVSNCNNGVCEEGESCTVCPEDCGSCEPECGNCACEKGETCSNCPIDCCGCGDGACNWLCGENYLNCPQDCRN